jgi:nucleoside-diphosphate-sugar epimerase
LTARNNNDNKRTVALTGATGFIGRTLSRRLCARGWQVRALVRSATRALPLQQLGIETIQGSLAQPESLSRLVTGVDAVIHCAGAVRGVTQAQFDRVNVDGVRQLAETAGQQPNPPRFLSLSSLAAREPQLSAYAASKRRGETALAETAGAMPWAAFRPPAVYGPGDKELLPLFRLMARGYAPLIAPIESRFSVIFVEDLSDAMVQWLEQRDCVQGVFELHDGQAGGYCWDDVIQRVEQLSNRAIRRIRVPVALLEIPAAINWLTGQFLPYAPMLTPGKIRELRHSDWVCDNQRIRESIAWSPSVNLSAGLQQTPGWLPEAN